MQLQKAKGGYRRHSSRITHRPVFRVLVLSGTGSCCYGRNSAGKTAKIGGWGHILGDKGSGYEIGLRALKAVVYYYDRDGVWSSLGQRILRALQLNEPNDLIAWVQTASKTEIAGVAVEVFAAWKLRDKIATDILKGAAHSLAQDAVACARRLADSPPHGSRLQVPVQFILAGSVLLKQPRFAAQVGNQLRQLLARCDRRTVETRECLGGGGIGQGRVQDSRFKVQSDRETNVERREPELVQSLKLSPTEQRNPRSMNLDKLPSGQSHFVDVIRGCQNSTGAAG